LNDKPLRRDELAKALVGAQNVHLLAHGRFERYGDPLLSSVEHIVTADDAKADAEALTAADLVGLPLDHLDLLVISSCEAGVLRSRVSGEIYGLPWALAVGGVKNLAVPRWAISAANNRDWMTHFYASLADGALPAEASAKAMRAMRGLPPYEWAAMQILGR
jgi:CHAT domain-containing protein